MPILREPFLEAGSQGLKGLSLWRKQRRTIYFLGLSQLYPRRSVKLSVPISSIFSRREKVFPDEGDLWDLLQCLFQAVSVLANFGLFLDLNFKNVQLSPLQKVEVYWGNVKVGNGHRSFY